MFKTEFYTKLLPVALTLKEFSITDIQNHLTIYKRKKDNVIYLSFNTKIRENINEYFKCDEWYTFDINEIGFILIETDIPCKIATLDNTLELIIKTHNKVQNFITEQRKNKFKKILNEEIFSKPIEILKNDAFSIYDDENDIIIYKDQTDYEIYTEYNTGIKHYHTDFETLQTTTDGNYEYIIDDFGDICIVASIECFEATTDKLLDLIGYIHNISQKFNKNTLQYN